METCYRAAKETKEFHLLEIKERKLPTTTLGNSLAIQWLRFSAFTAEDSGSIAGCRTKIPQKKVLIKLLFIKGSLCVEYCIKLF